VKVAAFAKCRWYVGRGLPTCYIAERLRVSPVTVRKWRTYINHDHVFADLRRRVMLLPGWQQDQLVTDLVTRRIEARRATR
jgi:uncharacterized protein YjcR